MGLIFLKSALFCLTKYAKNGSIYAGDEGHLLRLIFPKKKLVENGVNFSSNMLHEIDKIHKILKFYDFFAVF